MNGPVSSTLNMRSPTSCVWVSTTRNRWIWYTEIPPCSGSRDNQFKVSASSIMWLQVSGITKAKEPLERLPDGDVARVIHTETIGSIHVVLPRFKWELDLLDSVRISWDHATVAEHIDWETAFAVHRDDCVLVHLLHKETECKSAKDDKAAETTGGAGRDTNPNHLLAMNALNSNRSFQTTSPPLPRAKFIFNPNLIIMVPFYHSKKICTQYLSYWFSLVFCVSSQDSWVMNSPVSRIRYLSS